MDLLVQPPFWLAGLAACLLVRLPGPLRPMTRFGMASLGALGWLFGLRVGLAALLVSAVAWSLLAWRRHAVARARPGHAGIPAVLYLAAAIGVFLAHKVDLGWREDGHSFLSTELLIRLGYSFVFLRLLAALRATSEGSRVLGPLALAGYLFPLNMLVAGPVNVYRDHVAADDGPPRPLSPGHALAAFDVVATGLLYKFVIAEGLRIFAFGLEGPLESSGLLDSALLFVYLFFDFAGYSLIALGLGRLIGVPTPINFDRPMLAQSLAEFWRRWHASLGQWVRVNLFVPLQLDLVRRWGPQLAGRARLPVLLICFGFVGIWHGLNLPLALWGLGLGLCMACESALRDVLSRHRWAHSPGARRCATVLGPAYVFVAMTLSLHPVWRFLL